MCLRGVSNVVPNAPLPGTAAEESSRSKSFVSRPPSPDRTLSGMSILSTRSLLVGVYPVRGGGTDRRITVVLPPPSLSTSSSREKQTGLDPWSLCGETKDEHFSVEELTLDGAEHEVKGRERKRFAGLRRDVGPVAIGRCLPIGGVFLFFVKWRRKCRRRIYNGNDDDEISLPPVPNEIFVQLPNDDLGASMPIRCCVADSEDPNDDQSMWIGMVFNSGRLIEPLQGHGEQGISETERATTATENDGLVSDGISTASSVTLTVNLDVTKYQRNRVSCVSTSSHVSPVAQRKPNEKTVSLFNGFYA